MNSSYLGYNSNWKTISCVDVNAKHVSDETVTLGGWVHSIRDKKKLIFLKIRDSTGICQVTLNPKTAEEVFEQARKLTLESVVSIEGIVKADARSKSGAEISPTHIIIHSVADVRIPIDITEKKTDFDVDTAFKFRELSIRTQTVQAISKIKGEIAHAVREFYHSKGFHEIFTPYILASATEGGAAKFELKYFDRPAVLAQSCQFYKQASIATHERVFGIIPSWRAEKSRTPKHVTEFHQIENEIAFGTMETIMEVQEQMVHSVFSHVKEHCVEELKLLGRENLKVPELPFKRMTFEEAKDILEQELKITEPRDEDFSTPAETALSEHYEDPFFITDFPTHLRGMYYESKPENEKLTDSVDMIAPGGFGELSSGGQRVASRERLLERINEAGLSPDSFEWYLRMFQYGMPPHAGYGLGFERLVRLICGLEHIREASLFPRTPDLVHP